MVQFVENNNRYDSILIAKNTLTIGMHILPTEISNQQLANIMEEHGEVAKVSQCSFLLLALFIYSKLVIKE